MNRLPLCLARSWLPQTEKCGHIDPTVYANDIRELDKIVDAHWTVGQTKPLVIGPDCNPITGDWVNQFLRNASDVLNVYTYHNYVGYGLGASASFLRRWFQWLRVNLCHKLTEISLSASAPLPFLCH